MLMTSELKVGTAFYYENEKKVKEPLIVQKFLRQVSGRQGMTTFLRVQNLVTKSTMEVGLDAGVKFDEVELDKRTTVLSYIEGEGDGANYVFMDQDTYEQFELSKAALGDNAGYLVEGEEIPVEITFFEGSPVGIVLPVQVVRTVAYCEPGIKGDTSGKSMKPAKLDTGIEVRVPLFIDIDEKIVVDTRDGSFVERAK
ncbi:MAG: elongation factor P [Treponema sp.]|nr:elongation factor P [Treponema sp.]